MITHIARVDEAAGVVYFVATKESPLERHLYSVPIAGGATTRLTTEPGFHGVSVAKSGGRFIDSWSTREHGPQVAIRDADGSLNSWSSKTGKRPLMPLASRRPKL